MLLLKNAVVIVAVFTALAQVPAAAQSAPSDDTLKLGQRKFMLCISCHNADQGGGNKIGPNLYGVFGRKAGSVPDFKYSDAVKNSGVIISPLNASSRARSDLRSRCLSA